MGWGQSGSAKSNNFCWNKSDYIGRSFRGVPTAGTSHVQECQLPRNPTTEVEVATTKVLDFYDTDEDFETALDDAERAAVTDREMEFVASLRDKFEEWGLKMYLSEAQNSWLERIIAGD